MAQEKKVWEVIKNAGYEPIENKTIIVKYAPENLSAKIASFFSTEYYVLQICKDEILLIPFDSLAITLKKEVALEIPISSITSVEVVEDMLNYNIILQTENDKLILTVQQKELSDFRTAGMLALNSKGLSLKNWHKENLDETLESLKNLNK